MLLTVFFADIYRPLRLIGKSPLTEKLYLRTINLFGRHLARPPHLGDFDDIAVSRHLMALLDAGHAPGGVNKERSQLLAMWNLAAKKRLVPCFPEVAPIPEPERVPHAWTPDQLWRLRISCNMQPGQYCGIPARTWWVNLHLLLYATGERISAVRQARWSDVSGSVIVFPAANRKGSRRPNVCQLPDFVLESLEQFRAPARDLIFPFPYTDTYVYRIYHQILERAELPTGRETKFHAIRRTHATMLKLAGGDPTASLGHANPATTAAYIDLRQIPSRVAELLPKFPPEQRTG